MDVLPQRLMLTTLEIEDVEIARKRVRSGEKEVQESYWARSAVELQFELRNQVVWFCVDDAIRRKVQAFPKRDAGVVPGDVFPKTF